MRRDLLNLVIDEGEAALIKDDDLWFGVTGSGDALKWCVRASERAAYGARPVLLAAQCNTRMR